MRNGGPISILEQLSSRISGRLELPVAALREPAWDSADCVVEELRNLGEDSRNPWWVGVRNAAYKLLKLFAIA